MKLCDWIWVRYGRVPSVEELNRTAKKQLIETIEGSIKNKESCSISCGGIKTTCKVIEEKIVELEIEFILDNWSYEV